MTISLYNITCSNYHYNMVGWFSQEKILYITPYYYLVYLLKAYINFFITVLGNQFFLLRRGNNIIFTFYFYCNFDNTNIPFLELESFSKQYYCYIKSMKYTDKHQKIYTFIFHVPFINFTEQIINIMDTFKKKYVNKVKRQEISTTNNTKYHNIIIYIFRIKNRTVCF